MARKINESVEIYTEDKQFIMNGKYIDKDDDFLEIAVPAKEGVIETLKFLIDQKLQVILTSETYGLIPVLCLLAEEDVPDLEDLDEGQQYFSMELEIVEEQESIQRRRDIKVKVDIEVNANLLSSNGITPMKPSCVGHIKDISASGLFFVAPMFLKIGQEFSFVFPETSPPLPLTARIIRNQKVDAAHMGYGCMFVYRNLTDEEVLRQYVFRKQVEQRRRERG